LIAAGANACRGCPPAAGFTTPGQSNDGDSHAPVERDDEIHFPAFLVAQIENLPAFCGGVLLEMRILEQAAAI